MSVSAPFPSPLRGERTTAQGGWAGGGAGAALYAISLLSMMQTTPPGRFAATLPSRGREKAHR